jgi:hypothetical protein
LQASKPARPGQTGAKEERLCENCGKPLKGPYCYYCGQPTRHFIKAVPAVVREVAGETIYYDSRMWRTLQALLFIPGKLSHEYVHGKRARFTPPVRLYLVCSILAFLVVGLIVDTVRFDSEPVVAAEGVSPPTTPSIHFGDEPWSIDDNPIDIGWLSAGANEWLNRQTSKIVDNSNIARDDPVRFLRSTVSILPQTMFVLLPLFAALVGILYLFARRYYIEHLLLQVHNHAFLYLALITLYLASLLRGWLDESTFFAAGFLTGLTGVLITAVWVWIPIYLLLSLKRFYQQGWILTVVKFLLLGWVYFILLMFALVAVLVFGVWRL